MTNEYIDYNIRYQHLEMESLIQDLSDDQLKKEIVFKKWTIGDNMAHLGRYQEVFELRLLQILKAPHARIGRYVAEEDTGFISWRTMPPREIVNRICVHRQKLIQKYEHVWRMEDTFCEHPVYGSLSVKELFLFFIFHESHHLFTMFKLKKLLKNGKG